MYRQGYVVKSGTAKHTDRRMATQLDSPKDVPAVKSTDHAERTWKTLGKSRQEW